MPLLNVTSSRGRKLFIVILGVMGMFPALASDVYLPAFPEVANQLHVTINEVQFTLTSSMLGMALGMLYWGPFSDGRGRRRPAILGTVIYVATSLLCAFAPSLIWLVVFRFIQGFGSGAAVVASRAMIRDLFTGVEMARMLSAVSTIFFITPVLAPSIGAAILSVADWHGLFFFMAGFGLLGLAGILAVPESLPRERRAIGGFWKSVSGFGRVFADGRFRGFLWQNAASVSVTISYISTTSDVYLVHFGLPKPEFGLIFGVTALGQMFGAQVNRRLLKRYSVERLLKVFVIGQFSFAFALFLVGHFTDNPWLVLTFQVLTIFCGGSVVGNGTTLALRDYAGSAATGVALLALAQTLAGALTASLTAFIPLPPVLRMTTAIGVAALVSFTLMVTRQTKRNQIP